MTTHGSKKNPVLSGGARLVFAAALFLAFSISAAAQSTAKPSPQESPYKIEYSYKIKWGYVDEWLALFQKNHLPLLRAMQEEGRILSVSFDKPRYHASEGARWDFRVTITWKNISASMDPGTEQALIRKLFPDQAAFKREEQRRFELLLEHADFPVAPFSFE